ncbi:hypothetical protein ACO0SA_002953 [Hanseniaspora valbyensis]
MSHHLSLNIKSNLFQQKRLYHFFINKDLLVTKQKQKHDVSITNNKDEVQLLIDHGFIQLQKTGYYHYLPLGLKVINNITKIIDKEFQKYDPNYTIQKLELCNSSPVKLWQTTSRYPKNKDEVFEFMDLGSKRLLNPTCEEDITNLFKNFYKPNNQDSLPVVLYQNTKKFRNEKRPRFGLVRTKEFIMNDCYSFHDSTEDASNFFKTMKQKYINIFEKLKLPVTLAKADSGDIGGEESIEFQYINEKGEDTLLSCSSCHTGFNIEKFSGELNEKYHEKTLKDLAFKLCWNLKKDTLIAIYYPKNEVLSLAKIEEELGDKLDSESFNLESNQTIIDFVNNQEDLQEYLFNLPIARMIDLRINKRGDLPDWPFKMFSKYQFMNIDKVDLCKPSSNKYDCSECGHEETINVTRSIEIGHIFNLGDRYTNKDNFKVFNKDGASIKMGCYGIGVSRILQILINEKQDSFGCNLPVNVAPYKVNFVIDNYKKDQLDDSLISFIGKISENKFEMDYYVDANKDVKQFDKCKISNAIGIPINVLVNGKHTQLPIVEVEIRGDIINNEWARLIEEQIKNKDDFTVLRGKREDNKLPLFKVNYNDIFIVIDILLKCIR